MRVVGRRMNEDLKTRLARGRAILELLDMLRHSTGDPNRGWAIEKRLIDRELRELEALARPARRVRR